MAKTKIEVLECKSGTSKKGNPYNIALIRAEGRVGRVFSDVPLKEGECVVEIQLAPNQQLYLSPTITSIVS